MPKVVDKEEMRKSILAAAMNVYVAKGFHAANISDVAKEAGLGKGTIYLYFESKEALAISLIKNHFSGIRGKFFSPEICDTLECFAEQLSDTMDIGQEHSRFVRVFFEVFGPSFASDDLSAHVAKFFDTLGEHYAEQITHLQEQGEISEIYNAKTLGRVLASMLDGVILHRGLLKISDRKHKAMVKESVGVFILGLKARG